MIPVVDIAAFRADESSAAGRAFADELTMACHEIGFVQLTGHGIDAALEQQVHDVSRRFFTLPEHDRLEIANTNTRYFRGYTRLGMEHTNGVSDWRDQIDIGPEREPVEVGPGGPAWLRLRGPNQWPSAVPQLRPVVTEWMAQMAGVGQTVLRALAIGLGQAPDLFEPVVTPDPEVLVKIIRYPAQAATADTGQGVGAHHDSGLLSFIHQDDVGGLEVQSGDGFVAAPRVRGAYVLNLGEMLQLATHGYLRATRHRVVSPPPGVERISVAYFFNPCMESTLAPVTLPPHLAAKASGGQNVNPDDPVFETYGDNWLKFRIRSHPDVAAIHHPDLVSDLAHDLT
ncbi:MAG: isopenicillin N synthase family dioxygenase [Ilumatobacteraceae bacterium]